MPVAEIRETEKGPVRVSILRVLSAPASGRCRSLNAIAAIEAHGPSFAGSGRIERSHLAVSDHDASGSLSNRSVHDRRRDPDSHAGPRARRLDGDKTGAGNGPPIRPFSRSAVYAPT